MAETSTFAEKYLSKSEQPKNMSLIDQQMTLIPTKELEEDFSRQFYAERMKTIMENDKLYNDPIEFSVKTNADLQGAMSTIPEEYRKTVSSVPQITIDSLVEDKVEKATAAQINQATNRNTISVYEARDAAIEANKRDMPPVVQASYSSIFLEALASEREKGKMSAEFERSMQLQYAQDVTINTLSRNLTSNDLNEQQKLELIRSFMLGKTGNVAIDSYTNATERAEFVAKALSSVQRYDNYRESAEKRDLKVKSDLFDQAFDLAVEQIVMGEMPTPEAIESIQRDLMRYAVTPEQNQKVSELYDYAMPKSTTPMVIGRLEEAKTDGTFDKRMVMDYIEERLLVGEEAKKYLREAEDPLTANLNSAVAKMEVDAAKVNFADNPAKFQTWYRKFSAKLSDRALSGEEISDMAQKAYSNIGNVEELPTQQVERAIQFTDTYGISPEKLNSITQTALIDTAKQFNVTAPKELDSNGKDQLLINIRRGYRKYINEQKDLGKQVYIVNANGETDSDENNIIDTWYLEAKKQIGW